MADSSNQPPTFPRGSAVLEYWLVHAKGLVVQPLGARVEHVVVTAPTGRAQALIVRSRFTRRHTAIPAEEILAVEPSSGLLLLAAREPARARLFSPERVAAARAHAEHGRSLAQLGALGALRWGRAATVASLAWLRPRIARARTTIVRLTRLAAARTMRGAAWLAPRLAETARTAAAVTRRVSLEGAAIVTRAAQRAKRATVSGAERARASLEARPRR